MIVLERKYKIGGTIGEGGFGVVKEGYRLRDGAPVAIKIISKRKTLFTGRYDKIIVEIKKTKFVCENALYFPDFCPVNNC